MQYKFAVEDQDYSDLASGRVFYSLPGHPAFPVRLASEIFQRCLALRKSIYQNTAPCVLYDPCCGAAYHLSVLAFLHRELVRAVIGSDIDEKAVALARQNLGLLGIHGLDNRIGEITQLIDLYDKDSHKAALASCEVMKKTISAFPQTQLLFTETFQASAIDSKAITNNLKDRSIDVVFTDIPYGQHSQWHGSNSGDPQNPTWLMLDALLNVLSPSSIVAIASDKRQKISHSNYQRIEHFIIGKRRVVILKPA